MRLIRITLAAATLAAAGLATAPASAFTCSDANDYGTHGVPGVLTVQVCTEGVRVLEGPLVTTAGQVGVEVLGQEVCVGVGRVIAGFDPAMGGRLRADYDDRGVGGTPVFSGCP